MTLEKTPSAENLEAAKQFQEDLTRLVNYHSIDARFDLADFVIANYLTDCLAALGNVKTATQSIRERARLNERSNSARR